MENKNETLEITNYELEYGDLKDLQSSLQVELNDILDELSSIEEDREKLQNNQYLEEAIQDIIWDQVQNQLAVQIGKEFIKDNNGQKLDLRKEAHIQTAENFEKGKFASHNCTRKTNTCLKRNQFHSFLNIHSYRTTCRVEKRTMRQRIDYCCTGMNHSSCRNSRNSCI